MIKHKITEETSPLGVAVSGGPDSLALAITVYEWTKKRNLPLVTFTVDHNLRSESNKEAQMVKKWLHPIEHHILVWNNPQNIQELSRKARYNLLIDECKKRGINKLFIGHHQKDQEETFIIRLISGSGPYGLSCMSPCFEKRGIKILRPFLSILPNQIKKYLNIKKQNWIEDPSNKKIQNTRVRIRNFFNKEKINLLPILSQLQEDRNFFEKEVINWISNNAYGQPPFYIHIDLKNFFPLGPALCKRIIRKTIQMINNKIYLTGNSQINPFWLNLQKSNFNAYTLNGCYLIKRFNGLHIQRELQAITEEVSTTKLPYLWDNRVYLNKTIQKGKIRKLGNKFIPVIKNNITSHIPPIVWPTLPSIWSNNKLIGIPILKI